MTLCNENAPILVNEEMGCNIYGSIRRLGCG